MNETRELRLVLDLADGAPLGVDRVAGLQATLDTLPGLDRPLVRAGWRADGERVIVIDVSFAGPTPKVDSLEAVLGVVRSRFGDDVTGIEVPDA